MAHRNEMPRKTDEKVFNNTAKKTKQINIAAKPMRGGIRL